MAVTHLDSRLDHQAREGQDDGLATVVRGRAHALNEALLLIATQSDPIAQAATEIVEALAKGHLVLACGNGGSAAEAQHLVGELVGRFLRDRDAWPAIALTTDSSVLTSIANDYGYDTVFARQVAAFGRTGDVLVAFSTSGESPNVLNAARQAREIGMQVIALTGCQPTTLGQLADVELAVPAASTPIVQEVHAVLVHLVCEIVESALADRVIRKDSRR